MSVFIHHTNKAYAFVERFWHATSTWKVIVSFTILIFLFAIGIIELNRQHWLPENLAASLPENHFYAVHLAFSMLLVIEVVGLVFVIARSVADSVGKQFEILSLILLRQAFEAFVEFEEPVRWVEFNRPVVEILVNAGGSLLIFIALGFYYRIQKHQPITDNEEEQFRFVGMKKLVSLVLLAVFTALGIDHTLKYFTQEEVYSFFNTFYTILIFSDVLLMLISLRYCSTYHVVFRNSGFAFGTVVIRLALTAPPIFNVVLGVGAAGFVILLTLAYNVFSPEIAKEDRIRII